MSWVLVAKRNGGPLLKNAKFKEDRENHKHWKINDSEFQ